MLLVALHYFILCLSIGMFNSKLCETRTMSCTNFTKFKAKFNCSIVGKMQAILACLNLVDLEELFLLCYLLEQKDQTTTVFIKISLSERKNSVEQYSGLT